MKLLFDAQLPQSLSKHLEKLGHDAVHTLDLPNRNRTTDEDINQLSVSAKRIVVTKDADFVNSLIINGLPFKLLLISTGNIKNQELKKIFLANIREIENGFRSHDFIELDRKMLRFHF